MHRILSRHFRIVGAIAWDKPPMGLGFYLRSRWEMAYLIVKGRPPRLSKSTPDVWRFARVRQPLHPCQKPEPLMRQAIELVSRPGALICDPFAGVFSTGVAAVQTGRRFLGVELDRRFVSLGVRRMKEFWND